jgi:1,6-anhydro-N-acetylmuramate kinase
LLLLTRLGAFQSGGGSRNATLLALLAALAAGSSCSVVPLEQWQHNVPGLTSANKEAVAFAVLGMATLLGEMITAL